ncbi:protein kinase [bacterium]|nr:protein kinase [bacterium]
MSERPSNDVIFEEALGKSTPEELYAYLDNVCRGDEELRHLMVRMIEAHLGVGHFLETPVAFIGPLSELASDLELSIEPLSASESQEGIHPGILGPAERADSLGMLGSLDVLEVIARGGMGLVLRGFDSKLNREVAIKLLPQEVAANADSRRRFVREARRAASVVHENVIAIFAVEDSGTLPYIVMPFVEGLSLQETIRRTGPLPIDLIFRLGIQIAEGLAAIHARDLVHRDLKPANILIERQSERIRITDFGVAQAVDEPHSTQFGLIAGTPAYMSPEQAEGLSVDHRGDLFSLGSVLYAMCTGRPPFEGKTIVGVIRQVCDQKPKPVREWNPAVPSDLSDIIARLHERNPADRPQSAAVVSAELKALKERLSRTDELAEKQVVESSFPRRRRLLGFGPRARHAATMGLFVALIMGGAEATGVTDFHGTVVRMLIPEGTLVVEVDDPNVHVTLEGTDLVITGAGAQEIRLKPGSYQLKTSRDGKVIRQELVTVRREGKQIVRVSNEPMPAPEIAPDWEKFVAGMPPEAQVEAVRKRLQELNPGYDGKLEWNIKNGFVDWVEIDSEALSDISPLQVFRQLTALRLQGPYPGRGKVTDLGPIRGLPLRKLQLISQPVSDLEPLRGMQLSELIIPESRVEDLSPLQGMKLKSIALQRSRVRSLEPLRGMPLEVVDLYLSSVKDLSPLLGMPIYYLNIGSLSLDDSELNRLAEFKKLKWLFMLDVPIRDLSPLRSLRLEKIDLHGTKVEDLSPLAGMPLQEIRLDYRPDRAEFLRSFPNLKLINHETPEVFWSKVEKPK